MSGETLPTCLPKVPTYRGGTYLLVVSGRTRGIRQYSIVQSENSVVFIFYCNDVQSGLHDSYE